MSEDSSSSLGSERDLQDALCRWLTSERLPFFRQRMDRPTTGQLGFPDIAVFQQGRVLFLEMKFGKGKLSTAQVFRHAELEKVGCHVFVLRDLAAAIELVRGWLSMLPEARNSDAAGNVDAAIGRLVIRQRDTQGDWVLDRCGDVWLRRASVADVAALTRA